MLRCHLSMSVNDGGLNLDDRWYHTAAEFNEAVQVADSRLEVRIEILSLDFHHVAWGTHRDFCNVLFHELKFLGTNDQL